MITKLRLSCMAIAMLIGVCGAFAQTADVTGCMVSTATNYNADATVQAYDQYNNLVCTFASCDDIPDAEGCIYADTYAALREDFSAAACNEWGSACEATVTAVEGCIDANADNYNAEATVQGLDQYGNLACDYSSCDDIPDAEGCFYAENYAALRSDFTAATLC